MALSGFKAQNHPQQTRKRGANPTVDDRATPPEVFDPLDLRFHFTIDVAASAHNTKCERFFSIEDDGLSQSWAREVVWCNPPFSNIEPWVEKAWWEWRWQSGLYDVAVKSIVMLLPANRTEQGWWQRWVEPALRERRTDFRVEFLPGRLRFICAGEDAVKPNQRPPFGCVLLIWDRTDSGRAGESR